MDIIHTIRLIIVLLKMAFRSSVAVASVIYVYKHSDRRKHTHVFV